ncbi:MAG: Rieske 2Fe-2S domain-containing protein [Burkholderiaceae bacterium]|nr:Rieske 2Fe-2S domain-containing protein [Burkholderiaceae bacterium]
MDRKTQIALVERVLAHLDAGTTTMADAPMRQPVSAYTDAARLAREADLIRTEPVLMGFSARLPAPRSFFTDENTGVPLVMIRGEDGRVRAFANACRHRGARLFDGEGQMGAARSCPYHAWSFAADGRLLAVPDSASFDGLDLSRYGLRELPALERDGLIWARARGEAPIDADLGGLAQELASYGFAAYHHYETRSIACEMNWKLIIDTFLEPYHFAVLHRDTVAPIFFPNLCLLDTFGPHLRETLPRRSIVELRGVPREQWDLVRHTALVYVLHPNTVLVMQIDHAEVWRCFPRDGRPDRSVVHLEFYTPEPVTTDSARRHWERNMDLTVRTVLEEDFPIGEASQRSFDGGAIDEIVFGRNEPALAHFERTMTAAIAG